MNITFLIGNGFDIGMGIKSQFSDFFPIYIKESLEKPARIKALSENIDAKESEWSYFERQLGQYTIQFTKETKQDFIDQVRDFETSFIEYLKSQEESLSFEDTDKIATIITNGLLKFYSSDNIQTVSSAQITALFEATQSHEHTYNFVSFNYTSILEKCLSTIKDGIIKRRQPPNLTAKVDRIGKIVHVHGASNHYPIMGVNDASQVANADLAKDARFLRYIVKPSINDSLRMNYDTDATNLINASTILCVYGMSLGVTDRKWWDLILNWLKADNSRHLILFIFAPTYLATTPFDLLEKEDAIIDQLSKYSLNSLNAEGLRKRIHIAMHKNIFAINLAKTVSSEKSILDISDSGVEQRIQTLEQVVSKIPNIHVGKDEPKEAKEGDIWLQTV